MSSVDAAVLTQPRRGPVLMLVIFVLSLCIPKLFVLGPFLMMPHRVVLILFFFPMLIMYARGRAGRVIAPDILLVLATIWSILSLIINNGMALTYEQNGIFVVEFFGSYLLARVAIRTAEDFRLFVRMFFLIIVVLLPFAAVEAITQRPVLLDLIPNSVTPWIAPERLGMRRAQTLFTHPIHYGIFVSTGVGVFWYVFRPARRRILTIPVVLASSVFSLSTAALISFVCQGLFIGWETVMKRVPSRWMIFTAGAVVLYFVVDVISTRSPFHVLTSYASFNSSSAYARILIFDYGMDNVLANPIFGIGQNDWVRPEWLIESFDNFWLLLTMRHGIPFFLLHASAVFLLLRGVAKAKPTDTLDKACQAGFLVSVGGLIIAGATVHYWTAMLAFNMFFLGTGAWLFTGGAKSDVNTPDEGEEVDRHSVRYARPAARHSRYARGKGAPAMSRDERGVQMRRKKAR